jgi:hypothetical protein
MTDDSREFVPRIPDEPRDPEPKHQSETRMEAQDRRNDAPPEELPPPVGTLFLMMLYIMLLGGMWGAIYFEFLGM